MTDRELLELAAKAAWMFKWDYFWVDAGLNVGSNETPAIWNPLTDDGDALRLAVKLGLHICPCSAEVWRNGHEILNIFEDSDDDYAATRRAIVRAAAEIGKAMP